MGMNLTRRGALCAACALAGCFALGGGVKAFASDGSYLRPPGGQDDARLRALCLKCDRCRSVCPQGVVKSASVQEGFLDARTPYLDFHAGYCDFCGKCQEACPTQALSPDFDPNVDALGVVKLESSACLAFSTSCEKCKDSCAFGALSFDDRSRPVIDEELCNGCGKCVNDCQSNIAGSYSGRTRALEVVRVGKEVG